jgi:carboxylesterase
MGKSRERSVILVHGFTGSPFDFKTLAMRLSQAGFYVVIPVVPGQTRGTFAYERGSYTPKFYEDWLSKLVEKENVRFGKKPYMVGFSLGGALATIMASRGGVARLVLLAPYYSLPQMNNLIVSMTRVMKHVIPIVPKFSKGQINDPVGYGSYEPGSLIVSLSAFNQLQELAAAARRVIPEALSVPTLIIASPHDKVASFARTESLFSAAQHTMIKEYIRSNHILLYDYDRDSIITEILNFLEK